MSSDLDQRPEPPPRLEPPAPRPEPWSATWSWIIRVSGLAIMAQQAFLQHQDRKWLLLCAMGMMLGEVGLKSLLRVVLRNAGGG